MNSTFEPHRCPACSAEIPAEAPQGLCPKCLLMGVASLAVPPASSSDSLHEPASSAGEPAARVLSVLRAPWGTATEFVAKAIENELLLIHGNVFSQHDTHFRLSFAAEDQTLERGVEVLKRLAHA